PGSPGAIVFVDTPPRWRTTMPVRVSCPSCSVTLNVKDELVGKTVKCPKCGTPFPITAAAPPEPPAAPPPPPAPAPRAAQDDDDRADDKPPKLPSAPFDFRVSQSTYDRLRPGMSRAEVEELLGAGRAVKPEDLPALLGPGTRKEAEDPLIPPARAGRVL